MILGLIAAAAAIAQPTALFSVPPQHRLIEGVAMDGRTGLRQADIDQSEESTA